MPTPKLIDVHTHVQFHAFANDADEVIRRAHEAGVWMINVGTQRDTSAAAIAFAHRYAEGVYATVGLHPIHTEKSYHDVKELGLPAEVLLRRSEAISERGTKAGADDHGFTSRGEEFDYALYKKMAEDEKVVAIGECGLDYYRLSEETKKKQIGAFVAQMQLAREVGKPLMIHCRNAFADLIDVLKQERPLLNDTPGIIHFFTGSQDDASALLDLGFSFSFGGVITFARDYDPSIISIPLDRIVLETDAPYVTPVPHRGKRNEPLYIEEAAKKMAELKQCSFEDVAGVTVKNARKLFRI